MLRVLLLLCLVPVGASRAQADPDIRIFRWEGANGYALSGAMAFDAETAARRIVTERDLTCFVIAGTRDGRPLGRWRLTDLAPDTSWRLHFDRRDGVFVVEGMGIRMPKAWNMNGRGDDCGPRGFGFNIGNLGHVYGRVPATTPATPLGAGERR